MKLLQNVSIADYERIRFGFLFFQIKMIVLYMEGPY